jgi:hypothetical protein
MYATLDSRPFDTLETQSPDLQNCFTWDAPVTCLDNPAFSPSQNGRQVSVVDRDFTKVSQSPPPFKKTITISHSQTQYYQLAQQCMCSIQESIYSGPNSILPQRQNVSPIINRTCEEDRLLQVTQCDIYHSA